MNFNSVQKYDLIFFPSDGSWWDFFIKLVSPKFTHVGIILDPDTHKMFDANFFSVGEHEFKAYSGVTVCTIEGLTHFDIKRINSYLESLKTHSDKKYSLFGGIKSAVLRKLGLTSLTEPKDKYYHCSELMVNIIRQFEPDFFKNVAAENVLPDDLARWERLKKVYVF